ncbi:MAG TPA: alpha-1,4-glucan--maltose-1-phosphate maltosyltransferase [Candidatus Dormibacteraeota bacterium]|jgi:starch synthase (maltosyl-transferring)|nr:alpha-1,4-glucan--maltose-1-phosphate maltosyltransferase [Candidatus Dormibacteraeota bacterium]
MAARRVAGAEVTPARPPGVAPSPALAAAATTVRVVVESVRPSVDRGAHAAKATVGVPIEVSADLFADGHDLLLAWVTPEHGGERRPEVALAGTFNDRWSGTFTPDAIGSWSFTIGGTVDRYGTWLRDLGRRAEAGQDLTLEFEVGARLVEEALSDGASGLAVADRQGLALLAGALRAGTAKQRLAAAGKPAAVALLRRTADRSAAAHSGPWPVWVDRELGGFSAWYEMFPRSEGAGDGRSGTFTTAAARLPAIAGMGFDIVYLPPVHPIGTSFRKGRNNALDPAPGDVGSPWAIGSAAGGHTAVAPELGTLADFDAFVAAARAEQLEVALDFAIQCSPDHPWVREHPEWFKHRPDGGIRYAENPPKRYQDIYPVDFETADAAGLWRALRDVLEFWIARDVRVFRVDNPHTKSLRFWEWLIADVRATHPEVLFLSEAFTRPRVMQHLAKVGFTQSYTYFTWRNTKPELTEYLAELSSPPLVDFFRPNFWVNTPDILHEFLQTGGPPAFRLRAVLAALAAPSWGMYSGYELAERVPVRAGSEEYLDSEKYQLRPRDWNRPDSLAPLIADLNRIRRRHREAIGLLRTLRLHHVDNEAMLCFSRADERRRDVLLTIVNLDPHNVREGSTWLDTEALGIPDGAPFTVHDELDGQTFDWRGPRNYVRLDPAVAPAHVFSVRRAR